jgi:hypothetical protein
LTVGTLLPLPDRRQRPIETAVLLIVRWMTAFRQISESGTALASTIDVERNHTQTR